MFQNRQELAAMIRSVMEEFGVSIMDAIIHICEKYNIEEETIAVMIRQSHKLKDELREEATALRMLRE